MAVRVEGSVQVEGVKELRASLRKLGDRDLKRRLADVNQSAATVIATEAQSRYRSGTRLQAHYADAVQAQRSQVAAQVVLQQRRFPGVVGAEFGGGKYGRGNPTPRGGYTVQFGAHRGRLGGPLFASIRDLATGELAEKYGDEITRLMAETTPVEIQK